MVLSCIRGLAILLFACRVCFSLDPKLGLTQYLHTRWTWQEGAVLPEVRALAQAAHEYLWIGTSRGLFRFDGLRFVKKELPGDGTDDEIFALAASRNGGLWISKRSGLLKMDPTQHFTAFPNVNGLPRGPIVHMLEDRDGRLWVGSHDPDGLVAAIDSNGTVVSYHLPLRASSKYILALYEDRAGHMWAGSSGICELIPTRVLNCLQGFPMEAFSIIEDETGLLISDAHSSKLIQLSDHNRAEFIGGAKKDPRVSGQLMRDRDGNIWIGSTGKGLFCLRGKRLQQLTRRDGLSSDIITSLLEDREGNIWAGTENGLERFRNPTVLHISTLEGLSGDLVTAVAASRNGGLWVATNDGINRLDGDEVTHFSASESHTIFSLYEDARRTLWIATSHGLETLVPGQHIAHPVPGGRALNRVFAMTGNSHGEIWAADQWKGIYAWRNGKIAPFAVRGSPRDRNAVPLLCSPTGDLWVGYFQGGVAAVASGQSRLYGIRDGMASGRVEAIHMDSTGTLWIGSSGGLSRFKDNRWTSWTHQNGLPQIGIQGIVADEEGGLWLMAADELLYASPSNFVSQAQTIDRKLKLLKLGPADGIHLGSVVGMTTQRIVRTPDGRVWIATPDGLAVINPQWLRQRRTAPSALIENVIVDDNSIPLDQPEVMHFRGRKIQIQFSAVDLSEPERVSFKYRLQGLDSVWSFAGTRREIVYSHLAPGKYRFDVLAAEADIWNSASAGFDFVIRPLFYQTLWFQTLVFVASASLFVGLSWLRKRQLKERFRLVLDERSRLSRELHDTLLQGFAGVVYQLEAAFRQFDVAPDLAKERLQHALERADHSLKEGRETIAFMRSPEIEDQTLSEILSTTCAVLVENTQILVQFRVTGEPFPVPYDVRWNVYVMAREAVVNAVNHASPGHIALNLNYSGSELEVVIEDDGVGFDIEVAKKLKNRWGLRSMEERASRIGARVAIRSEIGKGTRFEAIIPRGSN